MVYTFLYSLGLLAAGTRLFVLLAGVGMLKWVEAGEGGGGGEALGDHLWPPFNGNHQHQQWHAAPWWLNRAFWCAAERIWSRGRMGDAVTIGNLCFSPPGKLGIPNCDSLQSSWRLNGAF